MNALVVVALLLAALTLASAGLGVVAVARERRRGDALAERLQAATVDLAGARERARNLEDRHASMGEFLRAQATESARAIADQMVVRAKETFEAENRLAGARMDAQLKPVADSLSKFEAQVTAMEQGRAQSEGGLKQQIDALMAASTATQNEARRLSTALSRGAGVQGRWGEQMLRNVLELSGLRRGVDFDEQVHAAGEGGASRPDVVVRLPGGGVFVMDSKVSLDHYTAALQAEDEPRRAASMQAHVESVRRHVHQLSGKTYWAQFDKPPHSRSPDVVVMFVPSESAFACAAEHMPTLVAEAWEKRVAIVTPAALFPLLRAVAYGWRAEDQAANARHIAEAGRELHRRVSAIARYAADLGAHLDRATKSYNAFTASLERNVLTQARRFETLNTASDKPVVEPPMLEGAARPLVKLASDASEAVAGTG